MIELLYTGAIKQDAPQIEPIFSLGGFLSSSPVANDFFSNLFGEITLNTIKNKSIEHIAIGVKTEANIQDMTLTIKTTRSSQARFRVGAVSVSIDECKVYGLPKMQNLNSKPVNVSFVDFTSFYGETKIGFSSQQTDGELFKIVSGIDEIGEFILSKEFDYAEIYSNFTDDFSLEKRFDYTLKAYNLILIQKNLSIFNPAIEVLRVSDGAEVGDVENTLPSENIVSLGTLSTLDVMVLYFERTISRETIRENSKLNCEKLFDDYEYEVAQNQNEELELELNYEITPA